MIYIYHINLGYIIEIYMVILCLYKLKPRPIKHRGEANRGSTLIWNNPSHLHNGASSVKTYLPIAELQISRMEFSFQIHECTSPIHYLKNRFQPLTVPLL